MRYGIVADIHGNYRALTALLAAFEPYRVERWVNLGDLVGYGPESPACIEWARANAAVNVLGNHDYALLHPDSETLAGMRPEAREAIAMTRRQLDDAMLAFLGGLPRTVVEGDMTFFHASADDADPDYWPYILDRKSARFNFYLQETPVACFGHGHIPLAFARTAAGLDMRLLDEVRVEAGPGYAFLWSPGSVGQSRDGDRRAAGLFYDSTAQAGRLVRAEYDVERTRRLLRDNGWPAALAERL